MNIKYFTYKSKSSICSFLFCFSNSISDMSFFLCVCILHVCVYNLFSLMYNHHLKVIMTKPELLISQTHLANCLSLSFLHFSKGTNTHPVVQAKNLMNCPLLLFSSTPIVNLTTQRMSHNQRLLTDTATIQNKDAAFCLRVSLPAPPSPYGCFPRAGPKLS